MQHRGLHARSVHANPISRHCWVMVRRGFCLCYRDDMKIETCFPPALQAWMVFWHRIFCSGAVGPVMARPHHPCRLSCSRVWDRPSLRPRPRPPPKPPRCPLLVVHRRLSGGLFYFPLPRRQSTPTPKDDLRDCSNSTAKHPDNWDHRATLVQNIPVSSDRLSKRSPPRHRRPHPLLMSSGDSSKHHGSRHRRL